MSMAAYNNFEQLEHYVIPSLLNQTFTDWKLYIVFDGATPENIDTWKWFLYKVSDPRIDYTFTERVLAKPPFPVGSQEWNIAGYNAVNKGLKDIKTYQTDCKYIAHLDADDAWLPKHLETCVDLLDRSEYDIAYSQARYYTGDNYIYNLGQVECNRERLEAGNFIAHSSIVYRINAPHEYYYSGVGDIPSDYKHLLSFGGKFGSTELETCLYFQRCSTKFAVDEYTRLK